MFWQGKAVPQRGVLPALWVQPLTRLEAGRQQKARTGFMVAWEGRKGSSSQGASTVGAHFPRAVWWPAPVGAQPHPCSPCPEQQKPRHCTSVLKYIIKRAMNRVVLKHINVLM